MHIYDLNLLLILFDVIVEEELVQP